MRYRASKVLQKSARGFRARRTVRMEMDERKAAASKVQLAYRGKQDCDRGRAEHAQHDRAAAILQANTRGRTVRQAGAAQDNSGKGAADAPVDAAHAAHAVVDAPPVARAAVALPLAAPPDAPRPSECILDFGGDEQSRARLSAQLAARSGGTHVTKLSLLAHQAQTRLTGGSMPTDDGKLVKAADLFSLMLLLRDSKPPPYYLDNICKVPAQLAQLEEVIGVIRVAVQAPGIAMPPVTGMLREVQGRLHVADGLDNASMVQALAAIAASGIQLHQTAACVSSSPTEQDAALTNAKSEEVTAATKVQAVKRGNDERARYELMKPDAGADAATSAMRQVRVFSLSPLRLTAEVTSDGGLRELRAWATNRMTYQAVRARVRMMVRVRK